MLCVAADRRNRSTAVVRVKNADRLVGGRGSALGAAASSGFVIAFQSTQKAIRIGTSSEPRLSNCTTLRSPSPLLEARLQA